MRASFATALVLAALAGSAPARADLPAPAGYVELCTPARQQKPGTECYGCPSYHGSLDKCPKLLASQGLTKACQSRGASVWTEVWCRPAGGPALTPEAAKEVHAPTAEELAEAGPSDNLGATTPPGHGACGSCRATGAGSAGSATLAALASLAVLLGVRRRVHRPPSR